MLLLVGEIVFTSGGGGSCFAKDIKLILAAVVVAVNLVVAGYGGGSEGMNDGGERMTENSLMVDSN